MQHSAFNIQEQGHCVLHSESYVPTCPECRMVNAASSEIGGRKGPDPTRYGDYEKDGRCVDF